MGPTKALKRSAAVARPAMSSAMPGEVTRRARVRPKHAAAHILRASVKNRSASGHGTEPFTNASGRPPT